MPRGQIQKTFKASRFIKNKDLGTRERSQRTKNKTVRYEIVNLDPKIEKKRKKWTSKEASILVKIEQNLYPDFHNVFLKEFHYYYFFVTSWKKSNKMVLQISRHLMIPKF